MVTIDEIKRYKRRVMMDYLMSMGEKIMVHSNLKMNETKLIDNTFCKHMNMETNKYTNIL